MIFFGKTKKIAIDHKVSDDIICSHIAPAFFNGSNKYYLKYIVLFCLIF